MSGKELVGTGFQVVVNLLADRPLKSCLIRTQEVLRVGLLALTKLAQLLKSKVIDFKKFDPGSL